MVKKTTNSFHINKHQPQKRIKTGHVNHTYRKSTKTTSSSSAFLKDTVDADHLPLHSTDQKLNLLLDVDHTLIDWAYTSRSMSKMRESLHVNNLSDFLSSTQYDEDRAFKVVTDSVCGGIKLRYQTLVVNNTYVDLVHLTLLNMQENTFIFTYLLKVLYPMLIEHDL
jgi:hypothetical protein